MEEVFEMLIQERNSYFRIPIRNRIRIQHQVELHCIEEIRKTNPPETQAKKRKPRRIDRRLNKKVKNQEVEEEIVHIGKNKRPLPSLSWERSARIIKKGTEELLRINNKDKAFRLLFGAWKAFTIYMRHGHSYVEEEHTMRIHPEFVKVFGTWGFYTNKYYSDEEKKAVKKSFRILKRKLTRTWRKREKAASRSKNKLKAKKSKNKQLRNKIKFEQAQNVAPEEVRRKRNRKKRMKKRLAKAHDKK